MVMTDGDWRTVFRPDIPSSARIYDYLLGGKDNFPADREAAEELIAILPHVRMAARVNRAFVGRAVRYLVNEAGITQFIDIGSGLPTVKPGSRSSGMTCVTRAGFLMISSPASSSISAGPSES